MAHVMRKYFAIYSRQLGNGPYHETEIAAIQERKELLSENPDDVIIIHSKMMTEDEYESLPEFEGY